MEGIAMEANGSHCNLHKYTQIAGNILAYFDGYDGSIYYLNAMIYIVNALLLVQVLV